MCETLFIDTGYVIALINEKDNNHKKAMEWSRRFETSTDVTIVHLNPALFNSAVSMYERYQDKTWGLVDCVSFVVMRDMKISTALSFDHHFSQAGIQIPG